MRSSQQRSNYIHFEWFFRLQNLRAEMYTYVLIVLLLEIHVGSLAVE